MSTITIRNLDPRVMNALQRRAAENGRSMEAEVRARLTASVQREDEHPSTSRISPTRGFGSRVRDLFADTGGWEPPQRRRDTAHP